MVKNNNNIINSANPHEIHAVNDLGHIHDINKNITHNVNAINETNIGKNSIFQCCLFLSVRKIFFFF